MSEQSEDQAIQQGHECAMSAVWAQRDRVASLPPGDRLHWWLGFLTAALGATLASIGEPAFRSLRAALAEGLYSPADAVRRGFVGAGIRLLRNGTYIKGEAPRTKKKA
jgi:hypothetical protein